MKKWIQYITVVLLAVSCNNDFIKDDPPFFGEGTAIIISPDWEEQGYATYFKGIGNAKFTIAHAPAWLEVSTQTERFINDVAVLTCKAKVYKNFTEIGIYYSLITLAVEGKGNLAIPVMYLIDGDPKIEVANRLDIIHPSFGLPYARLSVKNTGAGILFWQIYDFPEWLTEESVALTTYILPKNAVGTVSLSINPDLVFQEKLSGKVVLVSNDKNRPIVEIDIEINIEMRFDEPLFETQESGSIDFSRSQISQNFSFSNQGNRPLTWLIEGCPEWLSPSEYNGVLQPQKSYTLTFTCRRDLMAPGLNDIVILLRTNDKTRPSYPITVIVSGNTAKPENVIPIDGNITDAWFDQKTDFLYLTTSHPNRFVAYDNYHNGRHVQAHYVFANNAGTELVAIRNATSGNAMWSLEFIPITK